MRESIGAGWIIGIVVTFLVLFSGYLAFSFNYTRAYAIKNKLIDFIESEDGYTDKAKINIFEYLKDISYLTAGNCPTGLTGKNLLGDTPFGTNPTAYCIKEVKTNAGPGGTICNGTAEIDCVKSHYYQVVVFFRLELPIFNDVFTIPITGETKQMGDESA